MYISLRNFRLSLYTDNSPPSFVCIDRIQSNTQLTYARFTLSWSHALTYRNLTSWRVKRPIYFSKFLEYLRLAPFQQTKMPCSTTICWTLQPSRKKKFLIQIHIGRPFPYSDSYRRLNYCATAHPHIKYGNVIRHHSIPIFFPPRYIFRFFRYFRRLYSLIRDRLAD